MRRLLVSLLVAGVAVGLLGSPASAQTKVRKDTVGEAPARFDIRSVKIQNTTTKLAVTVRLTTVQKRRTSVIVFSSNSADGETSSYLQVVPVSKGRYQLSGAVGVGDDVTQLRCPAATTRVRQGSRGFIRIVVPQSCLGASAGRQVTDVGAYDKQSYAARQTALRAMRGDEDANSVFDFLRTSITTRRG